MSRRMIIILVGALVLIALGATIYNGLKNSKLPVSLSGTDTNQSSVSDVFSKGSIQSLITSGKNVTCQINLPDQTGTGNTYVSGNKVRNDFMVDVEGKQMSTHIISDGEYMYMWSDGTTAGTKFKIEQAKAMASNQPSGQPQGTSLDTEVDLKCSPWTIDNTKFKVPSDIQFSDLTQMMNNIPKVSGSGTPKMDSSICDQIPDDSAKAECLKALSQ